MKVLILFNLTEHCDNNKINPQKNSKEKPSNSALCHYLVKISIKIKVARHRFPIYENERITLCSIYQILFSKFKNITLIQIRNEYMSKIFVQHIL